MIDQETTEDFEQTIERLKKLEWKMRGCCLKTIIDSLLDSKKKEFLPAIQKKLAEYGFKENLRKVGALKWYPVSFIIASIFSFYEVLNWEESDIKEAGRNCPKSSAQLILRIYPVSLSSLKKTFWMLNHIWKRLVSFGELEVVELNEKEKHLIGRMKNFPVHPLYCVFIEGFGEGFGKLLIKSKKIWCEETKCSFKGDPYHEFILRWE